MSLPDLSIQKQQEVFQITQIGSAIGNADLIKAMFDESGKYWKAAVDTTSGAHLIEGVAMNHESKATAITDYALQITQLFINSHYPTLALFSKRAFALATQHRKEVLYRAASLRFANNAELFRLVVTELFCFDPFVVDMALSHDKTETTLALTKFIASANGDYVSSEDWNVAHEELRGNLMTIDFHDKREELINACLKNSIDTPTGGDIYVLLEKSILDVVGVTN